MVGYTHGGGIDKPLAIYRMDYDSMFPGVQIVAPHTDARGSYEAGTHAVTGIGTPCRTLPYQVADAIAYPSDDPENPPPPHADSVQVCVKVDYPAAKQWMTYKPRNPSQAGEYAWWGSLITGGRDASGQMYMRNRYYDPGSGRFTQEDPIGLAGGLNLYGFAGGDPVNFSDPYGLSPTSCNDRPWLCLAVQVAFETAGAVLGFLAGGGGGALASVPTAGGAAPAAVPAGALLGAGIGATAGLAVGTAVTGTLFKDGSGTGGGSTADESGEAREAARFARRHHLPEDSPAVVNRNMNVNDFIGRFHKANVRSEIPGEYLEQTVDQALRSGNTTVRKLLTDGRFAK